MTAPDQVLRLIDKFAGNRKFYTSGAYNETQTRVEFIDPFFEALGWDIHNRGGSYELYKDVVHEDAIKIGGTTKAPDYSFRIGGQRVFFVEAKNPYKNIERDTSPAFQVRRYGWSAKVPVSILTDFEEFAVYDCRVQPLKNDTPAIARIKYYTFEEYAAKWDELHGLVSRDAVVKGSLHRFIEAGKLKGTSEVDDAFLKEIEQWRDVLARNIALRNPAITQRELNFAVQRTIDRIIFLRIAEDRGIENDMRLQSLLNGENVYARLKEYFYTADDRYNSGLFRFDSRAASSNPRSAHSSPPFSPESSKDGQGGNKRGDFSNTSAPGSRKAHSDSGSEPPDTLTPAIAIDDKPLKDIIKGMYYPSPYEFSVFPAEILGQVYEQFLGKVIRLTAGHQAKVEEKPEVRKAGGVYYTPRYIVDYIVKQTVGKLVEGKTPEEVSAIRVLDPACGSGSFLIGAYQFLLDWHLQWYLENQQYSDPPHSGERRNLSAGKARTDARKTKRSREESAPPVFCDKSGEWRLTTAERRRILVNNIYGVDIDSQAVEVTKLSLLLKVLEGENSETLTAQFTLTRTRPLPDLGANIKCGNSLIGPDFYTMSNTPLARRLRPAIDGGSAKRGLRDEGRSAAGGIQLSFLTEEDHYRINVFDWQEAFPEVFSRDNPGFDAVIGNPPYLFGRDWKGLDISDDVKKYLGYKYAISPYQLDMFSLFMEKAHEVCKHRGSIGQIVPNVWLTNMYSSKTRAFILANAHSVCIAEYNTKVFPKITVDTIVYTLLKDIIQDTTFTIRRVFEDHTMSEIIVDVEPYLNGERPISTSVKADRDVVLNKINMIEQRLGNFCEITRGVHPYRVGGYGISAFSKGPQVQKDVDERPYNSNTMQAGYRPFVYGKDLKRFGPFHPKDFIKYGEWLAEPRKPLFFDGERIYSRKILSERLVVTFTDDNSVADQQVYITKPVDGTSVPVLCAVLGSRLISYYIFHYYNETGDAFPQIKVGQLKSLPIPYINMELKAMDSLCFLANHMLELNKRLSEVKTDFEKTNLQRQITATDKEIDRLVYELYGLTEEEIRIVEGK